MVPEGFALVPAEITKAMKEAVRENGGEQAMIYALAAWGDLLSAAPAAPLRTEVEVRAEARLEALESVLKAGIQVKFDPVKGETVISTDDLRVLVSALIEKEPQ